MNDSAPPKFNRILLKLSGEALMGDLDYGIDPGYIRGLAKDVKTVADIGVEVALVIGGGNIFRGAGLAEGGMDRVTGDHMGMLATVMNALALRDALERSNISSHVMSAMPIGGIVEHYDLALVLVVRFLQPTPLPACVRLRLAPTS